MSPDTWPALAQHVEHVAVGAAGAQPGKPVRHVDRAGGQGRRLGQPQRRPQRLGGELADRREGVLAVAGDAPGPHLGLDDRVELLDDVEGLDGRREVADQLLGQRVDDAQLEDRGVRQHLAHVAVGDAAGDDPDGPTALDHVGGVGLDEPGQLGHARLDLDPAHARVAGQHHVLGRVLVDADRVLGGGDGQVDVVHDALGVGQPGGRPQEARGVEALRQLERRPRERARLGRRRRLEHRQLGRDGVVAVVLLVLGRVHGRVVGGDDHEARVDAGVGAGEQRVGGHIDAHVLHRHQGPAARDGRPQPDLERHLLVDRPLGVHVRVADQGLQDLRRRRPGVPATDRDPGLPCAQRDALVAAQ